MTTKNGKQISAYSKMGEEVSHDERETQQHGLWRQCKQTEKGMEYRRSILEEKRGKLHSHLLQKSSVIDALLQLSQNMNTVREELNLFDDQFSMILEVHKEYHQLTEDKVKQEENEFQFDKKDKNFTFKHKVHNLLKQGEQSIERESKQSPFGKKSNSSKSSSKSSRSQSSNSSTKERKIAVKIRIAELKAETSFVERKDARV